MNNRRKGRNVRIFVRLSIFFAKITCLLFVVAGFLVVKDSYKLEKRCTETVRAVVVDFAETVDDDGDTLFAPVFSYDYDNIRHREIYTHYSLNPEYSINNTVEIKINPEKPTEIYMSSDKVSYIIGYTFIIIGLTSFFAFFLVNKIIKIGNQ